MLVTKDTKYISLLNFMNIIEGITLHIWGNGKNVWKNNDYNKLLKIDGFQLSIFSLKHKIFIYVCQLLRQLILSFPHVLIIK